MEPESTPPIPQSAIQCNLCLNEITYELGNETSQEKGHVVCQRCDYRQPLTKGPRAKDMAVFAITVGTVYITTIVAVILTR